jgi:hypothetical protein
MNGNNPSRRSRNIGTAKQGHGQDNRMGIPETLYGPAFFEKLENVVQVVFGGFRILVEATRENSVHACTVEDLITVLKLIPAADLGELNLIVLRQPKRKEEMLNPAWGRLIYAFGFEHNIQPAIILEAVNLTGKITRDKKMSVAGQDEFIRLQQDGHQFSTEKRAYIAPNQLEAVRNTQLYRTLFHEVGHYVEYQQKVFYLPEELDAEEALYSRRDVYFQIPKQEKELFAHSYADRIARDLQVQGKIPFPRILNDAFLREHGLRKADFDANSCI